MDNRNSTSRDRKFAHVTLSPTLGTMAELYRLPRDGGPASERFRSYVRRAQFEPGIAAYNPMAGAAALETVESLIALNAEAIALETAQHVAALCDYPDDFTLCIAVRSAGMWTHRIATEIDERAGDKPRIQGAGMVSLWSREPCSAHDVVRESAAEGVRVMWTTMHGQATSVRTLLAREGLAYAIANQLPGAGLGPYAAPLTDEEAVAVISALDILGDSNETADKAGVLFGDSASETLGWTSLGIADAAGYRWAIARATERLSVADTSSALLAGGNP